jgi:hypothetical protein
MKPGYFNFKMDKNGNAVKVWVEDSRKVYCSSVEALTGLLSPEIYSNERALRVLKSFTEKKLLLYNQHAYPERVRKLLGNNTYGWELTGRKYMPEVGEALPTEDPKAPASKYFITIPGLWDSKVNIYWEELVGLYDTLFAELNFLIGAINYFKHKSSF